MLARDPREPVVALDERPVPLRGASRPGRPMQAGRLARTDYEYVRRGTANIYCIVEPRAGRHLTQATRDRKTPRFVRALQRIARRYRTATTIHLILDNLNLHCRATVDRRPRSAPRGRPLGPVHAPLHAQAWQLAEPCGNRSQSLVSRMSWARSARQLRRSARSDARLDRARRSHETEDYLAFHHRQGPPCLPLQTAEHYVAVEALVASRRRYLIRKVL